MSPWMDNEKETDEMDKGVTFHFLFFFFVTSVKLILYLFSVSIFSIDHDIYLGNKKITF